MQNPAADITCPLCLLQQSQHFFTDSREYYRCGNCCLVFVLPKDFLSAAEEKGRYDLHENDPADEGYRRFLSRIFNPVAALLAPASQGLDFGSGPGPTLSLMFEETGHTMALYDPFYAPDETVFNHTYDFVTTSEVVEHLHHPRRDLDRIWQCVRPGGVLGVMTKRVTTLAAFKSWHYKNDPTHVIFFAEETFNWLGNHWGATVEFADKDVVIFHRHAHQTKSFGN